MSSLRADAFGRPEIRLADPSALAISRNWTRPAETPILGVAARLRMRIFFSRFALLLVCVAADFAAAQGQKGTGTSISRYRGSDRLLAWATVWGDADRKGIYTCEEWKRYATRMFNDADRNRDGYVDAQEFKAIQAADPMFKEADLAYFDDNRDGRLSRGEFVDKPNPFFAHYDRKGTCRVTLDDITEAENPGQSRAR
jgi:hypothetical protein